MLHNQMNVRYIHISNKPSTAEYLQLKDSINTLLTTNRRRINRQKVDDDGNPRNASGKLLDFGDGKVLFCFRVGTSTVDEYNQKEREEANLESSFFPSFYFSLSRSEPPSRV